MSSKCKQALLKIQDLGKPTRQNKKRQTRKYNRHQWHATKHLTWTLGRQVTGKQWRAIIVKKDVVDCIIKAQLKVQLCLITVSGSFITFQLNTIFHNQILTCCLKATCQ